MTIRHPFEHWRAGWHNFLCDLRTFFLLLNGQPRSMRQDSASLASEVSFSLCHWGQNWLGRIFHQSWPHKIYFGLRTLSVRPHNLCRPAEESASAAIHVLRKLGGSVAGLDWPVPSCVSTTNKSLTNSCCWCYCIWEPRKSQCHVKVLYTIIWVVLTGNYNHKFFIA